jgi:transposase
MNVQKNTDSKIVSTQGKPLLKIGIDAHVREHVIAAQIDGSAPKPVQRFDPAGLLRWLTKKLAEGFAIVTCYEAGPLGYVLHRQLTELGITNYVIRPRNWDDHAKRVKTDRTDARALLSALDRFLAGNTHALTVVQVPEVQQERRRSQSRIRESLQRQLKAAAQRGRGLALQYGYQLKGHWYGPRRWPRVALPDWLRQLLEPLRQVALFLSQQVQQQTQAVKQASTHPTPRGMGPLTEQILEREVGDWSRFKNRRQVSSYWGLCPSEYSSGGSRRKGGITKAGNARLRQALCQIAWRLLLYQPDYRLVKKWQPQLSNLGLTGRRRKQIVIAIMRGFAVDWWRLRTSQTTPEKLGLRMTT